MAGRGSKNHTHKYERIEFAGMKVFRCALPDCTHYMPKHMEMFILGKTSYCWACNELMHIDEVNREMDRPTCIKCRTKNIELPKEFVGILEDK